MGIIESSTAFVTQHWIFCAIVCAILYGKYSAWRTAEKIKNIPGSKVKEINSNEDWESGIKAAEGQVIVVDFFAYWCGPCLASAPIFAEWSKDPVLTKGMQLWKVDVDGKHTISKSQGIEAMPTFKFYRVVNGKLMLLETIQGWRKDGIRASIVRYSAQ
jgi:thiol-disulfide isomerase/thioredoxin